MKLNDDELMSDDELTNPLTCLHCTLSLCDTAVFVKYYLDNTAEISKNRSQKP